MAKQVSKTATPRLRFPEFRATPEWRVKRMDRLYAFMRNNLLSRDKLNYEAGPAKNIHYGDIHTKFPVLFDITKERVPFVSDAQDVAAEGSEDYCIEGDVIFADASEDMNDVGKAMEVIFLNGERLLSGQHTILARRKDESLIIGFGGYLFRSGLIRSRIQKEAQGTKVYQISSSRLGGIDIAYPADTDEQKKIADCLTSLDEVIAAQGRKVEALKAHKRGLMQQLFPREGETRPRLRFPEFRDADEWERKGLASIAAQGLTNGVFNNAKAEAGTYRLINVREMYLPNPLVETDLAFAQTSKEEAEKKLVCYGDVFFTRSSLVREGIAYSNIYIGSDGTTTFDGHVIRLRPNRKIVKPLFLHYALKTDSVRSQLVSRSKTATMTTIGQNDVAETMLSIPRHDEQRRIAGCLSSLDTQITAESNQLNALKIHKQGLMQQLFPAPEGM